MAIPFIVALANRVEDGKKTVYLKTCFNYNGRVQESEVLLRAGHVRKLEIHGSNDIIIQKNIMKVHCSILSGLW